MDSVAKPEDLLLAYDDEFTGFTAQETPALTSTGTLGGSADPDGYYEDFTARLGGFVRAYPRIRTGGNAHAPGGGINWGAVVVALDDRGAELEPPRRNDEAASSSDDDDDDDEDEKDEDEKDCGCNGGSDMTLFSEFVTNTRDRDDRGDRDDRDDRDDDTPQGEMDETPAELLTFRSFIADDHAPDDHAPDDDAPDDDDEDPSTQLSILGFVAK
jgi:hypothetical protein